MRHTSSKWAGGNSAGPQRAAAAQRHAAAVWVPAAAARASPLARPQASHPAAAHLRHALAAQVSRQLLLQVPQPAVQQQARAGAAPDHQPHQRPAVRQARGHTMLCSQQEAGLCSKQAPPQSAWLDCRRAEPSPPPAPGRARAHLTPSSAASEV